MLYAHRQFGRAVFFIAIGVAVLIAGTIALTAVHADGRSGGGVGVWVVVGLSGIIPFVLLLMFSSLRVTVDSERLAWAFGVGFPNYSLAIRDMDRVEAAHPSLLYGIGIRITPQGWLYNVGGGPAIAITTGKKTVLIGTDDPDGLMRAIERARGQSAGRA